MKLRAKPLQQASGGGTEAVSFAAMRMPVRLVAESITNEIVALAFASAANLTEATCFDIVRTARKRIQHAEAERKSRKDTTASQQTRADYRKKCEQVGKELDGTGSDFAKRVREVLSRHAPKKQTFQAYQTALRAQTLERAIGLLKTQANQQRDKSDPRKWQATVWLLAWALRDLEVIDGIERSDCLDETGQEPAPSNSKRKLLFKLDPQWRSRFLRENERSDTYRMAGVLLESCGVRPKELQLGIRLRHSKRGIRVLVPGAKVRDTAGQPWRTFLLDPGALPSWFVSEITSKGRMVVTANPDSLRTHLGRQSASVLNPRGLERGQNWRLSAYLFRHALVTDLRAAGWTAEEIAPVIGESSAATVRLYGLRIHGGAGPRVRLSAIVKDTVRVPRAVKSLPAFEPAQLHGGKRQARAKR